MEAAKNLQKYANLQAILFWDQRAEQLLMPSSEGRTTQLLGGGHEEDLFDRVFCALHQQLDPQKTVNLEFWTNLIKLSEVKGNKFLYWS